MTLFFFVFVRAQETARYIFFKYPRLVVVVAMCGIAAILLANAEGCAAFELYDALLMLQHRGQDAAGIITSNSKRFFLRKSNGLINEVVGQDTIDTLLGPMGIGHVRYPTAGSSSCTEAQPFYTNTPCGLCLAHNGNLTNTLELKASMKRRHSNTDSDSELLMNTLANELIKNLDAEGKEAIDAHVIFKSVAGLQKRVKGSYGAVALIQGVGIVAFRDPHGIRPLIFGKKKAEGGKFSYVVASESAAIDVIGYELERDVAPGEAIFIDTRGNFHSRICAEKTMLSPCIFEYVYFARPDSICDNVSVYDARLEMGRRLAEHILKLYPDHDIDCVMPIPDTSRTAALQVAYELNVPYREGWIKNRYIARTFIMPGQSQRKKNVQRKLNPLKKQMVGKAILFVDDSIVRGTTSKELVKLARKAGAKRVYFASAAPAIRYPNVYGIDMPCRKELIAFKRTEAEVAKVIGADWMVYLPLPKLIEAVSVCAKNGPKQFDTSCFDGKYVTGDIDIEYIENLERERNNSTMAKKNRSVSPLGDVIEIHNRAKRQRM